MTGFRDGLATAAELGPLVAALRRLHELLGSSALVVPSASAAIFLDERSLEHAWQAELLFERLPRRAGFEREVVIELGAAAVPLELLATLGAAGDEIGLVAGYGGAVAPWLDASLERLAASGSPAADRPLLRAIRLVRSDLEAAREPAERLMAALTSEIESARHAGRVLADLASQLGI